jgi:hypothetical protein
VETVAPGPALVEWWGHTALLVEDVRRGQARRYDYGLFGFDQGFVHRFVQGRLVFRVGESLAGPAARRCARAPGREVRVQELDLTPEQALTAARALADAVRPENREYLYHHYDDNCSTRPRDLVDRALGGQLGQATAGPSDTTLRDLTRRYSRVNPPGLLVLDYLQNDELERPITRRQEAFLPELLEAQLAALRVVRPDGALVPAVRREWIACEGRAAQAPTEPPRWIPQLLALGLLAGGLAVALARWWSRSGGRLPRVLLGLYTTLLGLALGAPALLLFLAGLFTDHTVAHRNENLLLANPLTLAALPLGLLLALGRPWAAVGLRWSWTCLAATSVLALLLKVLPAFDQDNWNVLALLLPLNLGLAAAAWLLAPGPRR